MPRKTARNFIMRLTSDSWGLRKYSILGTGGEIVGVLRVETRDAPVLEACWSGPKALAAPPKRGPVIYGRTSFLRPE
jgi:hypothetical protein